MYQRCDNCGRHPILDVVGDEMCQGWATLTCGRCVQHPRCDRGGTQNSGSPKFSSEFLEADNLFDYMAKLADGIKVTYQSTWMYRYCHGLSKKQILSLKVVDM